MHLSIKQICYFLIHIQFDEPFCYLNPLIGTAEFGEPCHAGMYKHLWSNSPKEIIEYPDYTFNDHFVKSIPSFPPRAVLRDYVEGLILQYYNDLLCKISVMKTCKLIFKAC